ncbi:flagellar hook-length control protein FliK [Propionivibrio sp.]|uniref:flagellar hook-length control protein FliK n=1 Tax=Propionivibrio sp. TaxID=2212460 RepID=UPI003BF267D8
MIPADVASRLQVSADTSLRPVAPAQEISDKLSGLVAGQKVMAEIQGMMPNGTYRAMINQRSITLALPFSAKSGDALELQVTESDGKLALAVLSRPGGEGGKPMADSSPATLSRTGQLISSLFSGAKEAKGGPTALPLNGNQPIVGTPPSSAQDLLPLLKQAITQSGMFYESHQAEWVQGRFAKAALLQEPQGKLSLPSAFNMPASLAAPASPATAATAATAATPAATLVDEPANAALLKLTTPAGSGEQAIKASTVTVTVPNGEPTLAPRFAADVAQTQSTGTDAGKPVSTQTPGQLVAPQAQPIVQQQLEALATQNFSWQGQVWPGQEMRWEIDENAARDTQEGDESAPKWSTRLHLTLPNLGEVDAQIRLQGNQITLAMTAGSAETRTLMRTSGVALRSQFDEAGLSLASMGVGAASESTDGHDFESRPKS